MAWTQTDLDKLSAAIAEGIKSVTYADGRKVEYQTVADMRALRNDMKAELAAAASQVTPRTRFSVARMRRL